ncbi:MAG: cell division protein ZapA [Candidatus Excrementavichristensenella sp.]|jgi:cell division protein ZapA|nr:cell division protein ZapA [Bacillota bacterium]NLL53620.1 cell division protein ZapA [Clostridiales bacterium]
MEKIRTTVRILGKEYNMTSYDPEEYVQRVASYVDRKMSELSLSTRLPYAQLAVLTALNVTDDMLKAHDENNRLKRELEQLRLRLENGAPE